jgi:hypothetical protein
LILPNAASVILGARDNGVSLVIECAGEDLVFMTLEHLGLVASVHRPDAAGLITAGSNNLVSLGVERYLGDFILVTL